FLPFQANKEIFLFSDIEDAVQSGRVNAGVIIHENRFTYEKKGLVCLQDLGQYWEEQSGHPIPLGGIVCRKDLEVRMAHQVEELIRLSIRYAYEHEEEVMSYVRLHAQEMNDQVTRQHISLYVNHFSENLGPSGRDAITALFAEAVRQNRIHSYQNPFLPGNL
ncbi:MAG: 1,4-dihydroxy-6-naphthoate synthase, partial [Saprospiraceae bacterium]|nr:1,4-dihydroxy-6-naphthoate synthase [Saprospiraceae bacterium]